MSRPRHLWSGDWESDSAAVTEELGRRRGEIQAAPEALPEHPAPRTAPAHAAPARTAPARAATARPAPARTAPARAATARPALARRRPRIPRPRARWRPRAGLVLLAVLVGLLSGAAAYGVVTLLVGSGGGTAAAASSARPWLGLDLESIPFGSGVIIADVIPGSPAEAAGLVPGDMITAIDGKPVSTADDVRTALSGLHVGNQVSIQYTVGPASPGTLTTQVTLAAEPAGYP